MYRRTNVNSVGCSVSEIRSVQRIWWSGVWKRIYCFCFKKIMCNLSLGFQRNGAETDWGFKNQYSRVYALEPHFPLNRANGSLHPSILFRYIFLILCFWIIALTLTASDVKCVKHTSEPGRPNTPLSIPAVFKELTLLEQDIKICLDFCWVLKDWMGHLQGIAWGSQISIFIPILLTNQGVWSYSYQTDRKQWCKGKSA